MISKSEFSSALKTEKAVLFVKEITVDFENPISIFWKFIEEKTICLLEGASPASGQNNLSFIAFDPYIKVVCYDDHIELRYANGDLKKVEKDLYQFLQEDILDKYKLDAKIGTKFQCGLIGYLTYECVKFLEQVSFPGIREIGMPLAEFIVPKNLITIDGKNSKVRINRIVFSEETEGKNPDERYAFEMAEMEKVVRKLVSSKPTQLPILNFETKEIGEQEFGTNFSQAKYIEAVQTCQEYIKKGHIFQVQISRRATAKFPHNPLSIYRYLRYTNPSPFMFYLKFDDIHLIGSSPEILVGVDEKKVTIRPLAGTRKRYSKNRSEDEIVSELLNDEKEKAEHIMLVDLARNDIGRACVAGSVQVNELMNIEKYRHVMHIVSDVSGMLKPECTSLDAFKFGFPAGTVTGAPKIRAMEIISEIEPFQREFYAGGIVFFDFQDNLKSTLVIRSLLVKDGIVYAQAAAGTVADSKPELEFMETNNKMLSALQSIKVQEENQ